MKMELPVKTIFKCTSYCNFTIEVIENDDLTCSDCFFDDRKIDYDSDTMWCHLLKCAKDERTDHKNVIFKRV